MSVPRSRRVLAVAASAVVLIIASGCGSGGNAPNTSPSDPGTAIIGDDGDPSTEPTGDVTPSVTETSPYPSDAGAYGLAFLQAVRANDQTKIVDFGSVNVYSNVIGNYSAQNFNGQWQGVNCAGGYCYYFNVVGNIAQIGIDVSKLGQPHAVTNADFDAGQFPTDAASYVSSFVSAWWNGGNRATVTEYAYAVGNVVNFVQNRTKPTAFLYTPPAPCGSGKTCVVSGTENVGTIPTGQLTCWTVQDNKLGKPQAIIAAKDVTSTGTC